MALKDLMARSEGEKSSFGTSIAAPPRTVAPPTSIDASTELTGNLSCSETVRIDGKLKGKLDCEKSVIIGQGAKVEAVVTADEVVISGSVKGDVIARRKITLEKTARVIGDLATPGIVIEEGAKLEGRIVIGAEEKPAESKKGITKPAAVDSREKTREQPVAAATR
jgi:cytoskeletal protein CcmA (bactofilin family)